MQTNQSRLPAQSRFQTDLHRLLTILMQREIDDPRLAGLTITEVSITGKTEHAWVKVHHILDVDRAFCVEKLNKLAPHFEHSLRRSLKRRRIPKIEFSWDDALDKGNAVMDTLQKLHRD